MNREQQEMLVRDISLNIADEIVTQIMAGKIPDTWDGHELRALLAERHASSAAMSLVVREPRRKRSRDYRNTVITNNL